MRAWMLVVSVVAAGCNCGGAAPGGSGGGSGGATGGGAGGSTSAGGGSGGGGGSAGGGTGVGGGTGGGLTDGGSCIAGATALTLSPQSPMPMDLSPVTFTVNATVGGAMQNVSSVVACTATRADDTPPGTFAGTVYTPAAAGDATIRCTDGCLSASTTFSAQGTTQVFNTPDAGVTARFSGTVVTNDAMKVPLWVYPNDATRFPRNIYKVLFQWRKQGNDYFRLTFTGPNATVVVYTDGVHPLCASAAPAAGCYESDAASWLAIAGGNAGEVVAVTIDAVRMSDANVYRSTDLHIGFSKRDVKGAVFYWSTSAAGIRRASVSDLAPEAYVVGKPTGTQLAAPGGTVQCVACHTVSRSGRKIVAFSQTSASTGEYVYNVTLAPPPIVVLTTQISTAKGFGTFSPDDNDVVATVGNVLKQFDATTGTKKADLPPAAGTNPDWSPAGNLLAYSDKGGDSPGTADLSALSFTAPNLWSGARVLVPAAGLTNLFPSFNPVGSHVAYARGKGGHGDKTLQLWLTPLDGGSRVELVNANRLVNNTVTLGQFENNMPTWAPTGDYDWVAFNSVRPYGVVIPAGGIQQIWVAAIDKAKLDQHAMDGGALDPSFPAFRFAFQNLTENNHRAYWTLDVRQDPDAGLPPPPDAGPLPDAGAPPDAGACLAEGSMCSQTGGPDCCTSPTSNIVCDVGLPDGGGGSQTFCRGIIIN